VVDEQLQARAQEHTQQPEVEQVGQPAEAGHAVDQALQQHRSTSRATRPGRVPSAPQVSRATADRAGGEADPQKAPAGGRAST
jgi:hypothetical protein